MSERGMNNTPSSQSGKAQQATILGRTMSTSRFGRKKSIGKTDFKDFNRATTSLDQLHKTLVNHGIDPARADIVEEIENYLQLHQQESSTFSSDHIDIGRFMSTANDDSAVVNALTENLAIPNWGEFCTDVEAIFDNIKQNYNHGQNASYIPILAEADPTKFAGT